MRVAAFTYFPARALTLSLIRTIVLLPPSPSCNAGVTQHLWELDVPAERPRAGRPNLSQNPRLLLCVHDSGRLSVNVFISGMTSASSPRLLSPRHLFDLCQLVDVLWPSHMRQEDSVDVAGGGSRSCTWLWRTESSVATHVAV